MSSKLAIFLGSPGWLVSGLRRGAFGWCHKDWLLYLDTCDGRSLHNLSQKKQKQEKCVKTKVSFFLFSTICQSHRRLTFTLEALLDYSPQEASAVVAEGGAHVVVGLEAVWHVDFETLLLELRGQTRFIVSVGFPTAGDPERRPETLSRPPHLPHLPSCPAFCLSPVLSGRGSHWRLLLLAVFVAIWNPFLAITVQLFTSWGMGGGEVWILDHLPKAIISLTWSLIIFAHL